MASPTPTSSLYNTKEALFGGMHIMLGNELLFMAPLSSIRGCRFHFQLQFKMNSPLYLVITSKRFIVWTIHVCFLIFYWEFWSWKLCSHSHLCILNCSHLIAGEWWNGDVDEVENEMVKYGGGPNISDAYTINGLPGPFYPCSNKGIQELIFRHFFFVLFSTWLHFTIMQHIP